MNDPLAEQAFRTLFPERRLRKTLQLRYSARFKDFNANITDRPGSLAKPGVITFSLSMTVIMVAVFMSFMVRMVILLFLFMLFIFIMAIMIMRFHFPTSDPIGGIHNPRSGFAEF